MVCAAKLKYLPMQKRVPVAPDSAHCSTCMLGHACVPLGMAANEVEQLDDLV